jgi:hypothetical protein
VVEGQQPEEQPSDPSLALNAKIYCWHQPITAARYVTLTVGCQDLLTVHHHQPCRASELCVSTDTDKKLLSHPLHCGVGGGNVFSLRSLKAWFKHAALDQLATRGPQASRMWLHMFWRMLVQVTTKING